MYIINIKLLRLSRLTRVPKGGCMRGCLSRVHLFVTLWTVIRAPLVRGMLQARDTEWVAICSFQGSFRTHGLNIASLVSLLAGIFFTPNATLEAQMHLAHKVNVCT